VKARQFEMTDDAVLQQRRRRVFGKLRHPRGHCLRSLPIANALREVNAPPQDQDLRIIGVADRIQLGACLLSPAEQQQCQGAVCPPVRAVAARGWCAGKQCESRFGLAVQQPRIREIKPRGHAARVAIEHGAQPRQRFIVFAAKKLERGKIRFGYAMARHRTQRRLHRLQRAAHITLAIAGQAEIHPGIGKARARLGRSEQGGTRASRITGGEFGLAERVQRVGIAGGAGKCAPRRGPCGLPLPYRDECKSIHAAGLSGAKMVARRNTAAARWCMEPPWLGSWRVRRGLRISGRWP
jgi:hypothetical protein